MKAVICGAGIAGLATAQRLAQHGWDVTVVEDAPGPRTQGYMIDFFGLGYDAAERMGVLPRLEELGYHVTEAKYVDHAGRRRAGLNYDRFSRGWAVGCSASCGRIWSRRFASRSRTPSRSGSGAASPVSRTPTRA